MATTPRTGGSNAFLYFIVGALLVAVVVLGVMFYNGQMESRTPTERAADAIENAADDIGDSVEDAARDVNRIDPQ
jgi:LPXTG-motif cell wall-anchored protein